MMMIQPWEVACPKINYKKYRLVKWSVVCTPKDQDGLGIHDLEVKNTALLGKWLFKLLTENGLRQTLLKQKYVGSKALSQVSVKPDDSHFWMGLMTTKTKFFRFRHFLIKDGSQIRFWEVMPHSETNILRYTISFVTNVIPL
jgi:hypothetical protein